MLLWRIFYCSVEIFLMCWSVCLGDTFEIRLRDTLVARWSWFVKCCRFVASDDSVMCFGDVFGYVLLVLEGVWRRMCWWCRGCELVVVGWCVGDVLVVFWLIVWWRFGDVCVLAMLVMRWCRFIERCRFVGCVGCVAPMVIQWCVFLAMIC